MSRPDGPTGNARVEAEEFRSGSERLERARTLVPENDQIYYLIGLLEKGRGRSPEAITALRKASELNPKNLVATFALAEEIERQGDENSAVEYQRLVQKILEAQPDNLAALLEFGRIAAKRGDADSLRRTVDKITQRSVGWAAEVQQQLSALQTAASGSDPKAAATRIAFLRNVLVRVPEYRNDLSIIKPPPGEEAQPFTHFLKMESPTFTTAPADTAISFSSSSAKCAGRQVELDRRDFAEWRRRAGHCAGQRKGSAHRQRELSVPAEYRVTGNRRFSLDQKGWSGSTSITIQN